MKYILILLLCLSTSAPVFAQSEQDGQSPPADGGPKQQRAERKALMQEQLGLSAEQIEQMDQIREAGGSREEIQAVLTEEQRAKMDEFRSQRAARSNKMRAERKARMQEQLGLSPEQIEQMDQIREAGGSREEIQAVLTEEQRAKMDELRSQRRAGGGEGDNREGGQPQVEEAPSED